MILPSMSPPPSQPQQPLIVLYPTFPCRPQVPFNFSIHWMSLFGKRKPMSQSPFRKIVYRIHSWIVRTCTYSMNDIGTERPRFVIDPVVDTPFCVSLVRCIDGFSCRFLFLSACRHLHKNGDVVLNSIDSKTHHWSDRKIERTFDNLYHEL